MEVHYQANDDSAQPVLTGDIDGFAVTCSGAEIDTHDLPIGTLITVTTLNSDRAGRGRRFSLLLPRVRGSAAVHELAALGIFITDHEHEVGRQGAVLETYATVKLVGTARSLSS